MSRYLANAAIILFIAAGCNKILQTRPQQQPIPLLPSPETVASNINTVGWKSYKNDKYNYQLLYPAQDVKIASFEGMGIYSKANARSDAVYITGSGNDFMNINISNISSLSPKSLNEMFSKTPTKIVTITPVSINDLVGYKVVTAGNPSSDFYFIQAPEKNVLDIAIGKNSSVAFGILATMKSAD